MFKTPIPQVLPNKKHNRQWLIKREKKKKDKKKILDIEASKKCQTCAVCQISILIKNSLSANSCFIK